MAQSRLEKIGTIFTRVTGLLKANAMKVEDKPIWYDVYEAFPPKLEPRFDRPAANIPIRSIFYAEDTIRAKYHKTLKQYEGVNLLNTKQETSTQQFIQIYNNLKDQGALDEEQIFDTAKDLLAEKRQQAKDSMESLLHEAGTEKKGSRLLQDFKAASRESQKSEKPLASSKLSGGIDIENLFKE